MMKRALKRVGSLLLALVMVLSLFTTALAASKRTEDPYHYYENYVAMGTSITGGYGIGQGGWGVPIAGPFGDGVYPAIVADDLNIEDTGRYSDGASPRFDAALLGCRTDEFRIVLEDEFGGDDFTEGWADAKCGNSEDHLKTLNEAYETALTKADLISVELGSNDIISVILFRCQQYLEELADDPAYADLIAAAGGGIVRPIHTATEEEGEGEGEGEEEQSDSELFAAMTELATELGFLSDYLSFIMETKDAAVKSFKTNFDAIMGDIKALNDGNGNADIFCVGLYNPFPFLLTHEITNNDNGSDTLKQTLLQAGEKLGLSVDATVELVKTITDSAVNEMNTYMKSKSPYASSYTYVDVTGIDLLGSNDGTHPGYKGHSYIAEHLESAILSLFECQHQHTTTKNAITPTILTLGYTGDVVCADCGKTLSRGSLITYTQWKNQQKTEDIPVIGGDEDPIFPLEEGQEYPDGDYALLAFTSDVHNKTGNVSAQRFDKWIDTMQTGVKTFDFLGVCGDLAEGNGSATGDNYWNLAEPVMTAVETSGADHYAVTTGNHEHQHGNYSTTTNATAKKLTRIGEATVNSGANYHVYCFGAAGSDYAFPQADVSKLSAYMAKVGTTEPVFILSHFPLHDIKSREMTGEEAVIDVLNNYPNAIFVWGHNHTEANSTEKHYDQIITRSIDGTPINFTYAAAGCMSDTENNAGSAAVKGKALIATVAKDENGAPVVTLRYVDANGNTVLNPVTLDITSKKMVEAIDGSYNFTKVTQLEADGQYLIVYNNEGSNVALDTTYCGGYVNTNNYGYTGFKGRVVGLTGEDVVTSGAYQDMVWKFESAGKDNTFYIKNVLTGTYLNATYKANATGGGSSGALLSSGVKDVWTYSNGVLKSANATAGAGGSAKNLAFDLDGDIDKPYEGVCDFFTVRSDSKADAMTFYQVEEGTVYEADPVVEEEQPAAAVISQTNSLQDGHKYLVLVQSNNRYYALMSTVNTGYTDNSSSSTYSGLNDVEVEVKNSQFNSHVETNMLWTCAAATGGFTLQSDEGKYLSATYTKVPDKNNAYNGVLKLTEEIGDVWSLNTRNNTTTLKDTTISPNNQNSRYLAYDTNANGLFTVKSSGTAIMLYDVGSEENLAAYNNTYDEAHKMVDMNKTAIPDDGYFVIAYANRALSSVVNSGYTTIETSSSWWSTTSTEVSYSGLGSKKITFMDDGTLNKDSFTKDMVWELVRSGSSYTIRNAQTGAYLEAPRQNNGGSLQLNTVEANRADTWTLADGILTSKAAGKALSYESAANVPADYDGNINFYTVRSNGSAVSFYYVENIDAVQAPADEELEACSAWVRSAAQKGTYVILINGYAIGIENGKVTATKAATVDADTMETLGEGYLWKMAAGTADGTWSLYNANADRYLSVYQSGSGLSAKTSLELSTYPCDWNFNNSFYVSFTTKGLLSSSTKTYYINCTNGTVALTNSTSNKTATLYRNATASSHNFVLDTGASQAATCENPGSNVYKCQTCGVTYSVATAATGHKYVGKAVAATCTEDGYTENRCSVCDALEEGSHTKTQNALGHIDAEAHDGFCDRCGTKMEDLTVSVNVATSTTTERFLLIFTRTVTTYTTTITTNVDVQKVEYSTTSGLSWKTGSQFEKTSDPGNFRIRVTDIQGNVTKWQYHKNNNTVTAY